MILTAIYLLICWLSTQVQVDTNILTYTLIFDIVWLVVAYLVSRGKYNK